MKHNDLFLRLFCDIDTDNKVILNNTANDTDSKLTESKTNGADTLLRSTLFIGNPFKQLNRNKA